MAFEHLTKKELLRKMESLRLEVMEYEKQESEKLYEAKLYRSLAVTAEAGVYIIKDGLFRFVNQFTASRLGCSPTELIGQRASDFIHPEDRDAVAKKARDMLRGKRTQPYEFRTVGKDGGVHWILESVTPIDFGAGRAVLGQSMDITAQVEARDRLSRLEALEASILESIPHAVIGLKNRRIIFANDGVEKVFGWKREEVIGQSTRIFYRTKKEWAVGADNLYRSLETQRTFTAEVRRKRKDGTPIICRLTASRIGDALVDKQVVITYEDITDQKTAEEVYVTMAESSQVGVYVVHEGRFLYINSVGASYAGYGVDELTGRSSMMLVHPDDRPLVARKAKAMLRGRVRAPHTFRIVTKDGRLRWIMETVTPIRFQGKKAILGNSMDITEHKEAQDRLAELEALEASILEAIPHAVIGVRDKKVFFANDGVEKVFGWKPREMIGQEIRLLYRSESESEVIAKLLYSTLERRRTFSVEYPCRRKDGVEIQCMISAARIGEKLEHDSVVITFENITYRKLFEKELELSRGRLRDLSMHLQTVREKERTRIARELHDELGQLLTALNTGVILLRKKIPPDQEHLQERTKSMKELIDLTMQTVKRIYMDLRPGMLDHLGLPAAIEWQCQEFQRRTGIRCSVNVEPEDMVPSKDASITVFRILQETLTNVAKHAKANRVRVSLKGLEDDLELVVEDNGRGIRDEDLQKTKSFGLLGVRERVDFRGGEVKISGKKGKGTTVTVRLPAWRGGEA
ncbi:MAG TPA: PAS domain S-box protein [Syntrophales bacterium]|nr:PAS domain S-box protein [Syntrophales bacterium]